ncbi:hypothetical protein [Vreelandella titanicae]|uniref:hypothetical protein n=1 Tax=Vreelandella titanicae TaxID=664683 RepID=UPI0011434F9C|nr:hypothetical protein [Halomonas titanicae]
MKEEAESNIDVPKWKEATDLLLERLANLNAAGNDGFEGLMRDMLVELTGMPFSLAKSGHQGGSDVRSEPANFFKIGLEAKRYQKGTSLPVDQLKAKILEAARSDYPIDLWILAASRSISVTDKEALSALADQEGIKVVVLDWDDKGATAPIFPLALASATSSVKAHLGKDAALAGAISTLRTLFEFGTKVSRLMDELSAADAGYASATRAVKRWLENSQQTKSRALARLKGHHDLLSSSTKLVERLELHASINDWWAGEDLSLVLLGNEGTGKSWAALSWWYKLAESENEPLTIFLPAKDIQGNNPIENIAAYLAEVTELRGREFWKRRLSLWDKAPEPLSVLIILDGLNQNWSKQDWSDFLQPVLDDTYRGRFRVLMTCWPDWWSSIGELKNLEPKTKSLEVTNFTDSELNALLKKHGIKRAEFSGELINLIRVPRLFTLALKHREELSESGDITAERLAYEDWKHRLSCGSARVDWSDQEFQHFIADLGGELGVNFETATLTTKQLIERLGRESGAEAADLRITIQDLVAGRWLEPSGDPNHYRINKKMAPFVLGIALASQLRAVDGLENANAHLADFVDPYRGQSLGVSILRAAATAALLDPRVGNDARKGLLLRWLCEQNFGASDFEAWWRLIGVDTDLFCSLIEDQWLYPDRRGSVSEDEVFIKGLANAYEFDAVAPKVRDVLTKWMGCVWPDPEEGQFIGGYDPNSVRSQENRTKVLENLVNWERENNKSDWPNIHYLADGNVSWLSHRALGVLSFIPRAPLSSAFEAWAISRSILGRARHIDELAWVLRLNMLDDIEARDMLHGIVERLLARTDKGTDRAAVWLLNALGDRECLERAAKVEAGFEDEERKKILFQAGGDNRSPLDPAYSPVAISENIPKANELWQFPRSSGEADLKFDRAEPLLCRTNPGKIRSIFVETAASAVIRTDNQLSGLALHVRKIVILLNKEERLQLASVLRNRAAGIGGTSKASTEWKCAAGMLELWEGTALQQFKQLRLSGFEPETLEWMLDILTPMLPEEASKIGILLPEATHVNIECVLTYLIEAEAQDAACNWIALQELVLSGDAKIKNQALRLASIGRLEPALRCFIDSGWAVDNDKSRDERAYGSFALSSAADMLQDLSLLNRADSEIWGWRLQYAKDKDLNVDKFHEYLRNQIFDLERNRTRTQPNYSWLHKKAIIRLVELREEELMDWFVSWLDDHEKLPFFSVCDSFPLIDLAWVLIEKGLSEGLRLWEKLVDAEREGIHKYNELVFMPLYSPKLKHIETYKDKMLSMINLDAKIRDFVWHTMKAKRAEWLAEMIRDDVKSESGFRQARGWKLLGYTDNRSAFSNLWIELNEYRSQLGWLRDVANAAEVEFKRNCWAKHWYEKYIASSDVISLYVNFQLLCLCIDSRARFWMIEWSKIEASPLKNVAWSYWKINIKYLNKVHERRNKEEKNKLFGLDVMKRTQAPWF